MILLMFLTVAIVLLVLCIRGFFARKDEINPFHKVGAGQMRTFIDWFTGNGGLITLLNEAEKMVFRDLLTGQLDKNKNFVENAETAYLALVERPSADTDEIVYYTKEMYKKLKEQCYNDKHQFIGDKDARLKLTICDSFVYILRKRGHML